MPTSEDLLIVVNGQTVTDLIPFSSLTIIDERGKRISSASMTIENGASLGIAQWQSVLIYSPDLTTVYFNGFIMSFSTVKRGVYVDYTLDCSGIEILLQKAIINGSYTGTDDTLLTDMLSNAYPDLSDIFDWTSDITPVSLSALQMDFQDMTLMESLDALSTKVGNAPFKQGYNNSTRVNLLFTPGCETGKIFISVGQYNGKLIPNSAWASTFAAWSKLFQAGDAFGESGGGLRLVCENFTGIGEGYRAFMAIGRRDPEDPSTYPYTKLFRIARVTDLWLMVRFRVYVSGTAAGTSFFIRAVTYDKGGNIYHDGSSINLLDTASPGSWTTINRAIPLSSQSTTPTSGWIEVQIDCKNTSDAATIDFDNFLFEFMSGASEPSPGAWFDGDSSDARWLGTANESRSMIGKSPLTWGTNPDAAFDVDIGNMNEIIDDFEYDFNGFDGINSVIVTGGYQWQDVDWEYPAHGNAVNTHFDLEVPVYAAESFTFPIVYINIGDDSTPNWSTQIVANRDDAFATADVLYDLEGHWLEFQTAPPDLDRSFRITGRIKERIRAIVQNETNVDSTGVEMTNVMNIDTVTTPSEAFDIGQSELANREPGATIKFSTYEPGLVAGAEIDIVDGLQSINETIIIERVTRNYLGGGKGKFLVECGKYQSGLDDVLQETHYIATDRVPIDENATVLTIRILTDDDSGELTDDNGLLLADIA
jgi:hypothetical protein